jgi:hypothetical protein
MDKAKILTTAKAELMRHSLETFIDEPRSMAQGGKGVVVTGCPRCRTRLNTTDQFMRHLADDVLPPIVDHVPPQPDCYKTNAFDDFVEPTTPDLTPSRTFPGSKRTYISHAERWKPYKRGRFAE